MVKFWKTMGKVGGVATILLLVGGLNWGLQVFNFNLVSYITTMIFGAGTDKMMANNIVYGLVGISAIYSAYALFIRKR